MKRKLLLILALLPILMLSSCDKSEHSILPNSIWVQTTADGSEHFATTLSFSGRSMAVLNATHSTSPLYDGIWDYYIEDGVKLHASIDYYDPIDDMAETEVYEFDYSLDASETRMTLEYKPLLGSRKRLYFAKE